MALSSMIGCSSASAVDPPVNSTPDADAGVVDAERDAPPPPPAEKAHVHFVGRFDRTNPDAPRFAWSGTGILAKVQGTRIDVELADTGDDELAVLIDGAGPKVVKTSGPRKQYTLATGLAEGEHQVAIWKRTEAEIGTLTFNGFAQKTVETPRPFSHRIEFVGDSITCGYGIDIDADFNCPVAADENAYASYGAVTARTLGADFALVSWSGKGMVRNFDGDTSGTMPVLYDRALPAEPASRWNFSQWVPEVVVINLSTNDYASGNPGQRFADAYAAFLTRVRAQYPDAFLVCALGPMLTGAELKSARTAIGGVVDARRAKGDLKTSFLEFPTQRDEDGNGCSGHPSAITHRKMAERLSAEIRSLTGW